MQESCAIRPYENAVAFCSMCGMPLSEDYLIEFGSYHVCYGCFVNEDIEEKAQKSGAPAARRERRIAQPAQKTTAQPRVKRPPREPNPLNHLLLFFIGLLLLGYVWFFKGDLITSASWDTMTPGAVVNMPNAITSLNASSDAVFKEGSTLGLRSQVAKKDYSDIGGTAHLSVMKIQPSWASALYKLYIVQVTNRLYGLGLSPQGGDKYTMVDAKKNIARTLIFKPGLVIVLESANLSAVHHKQAVKEALEAINK